MGNIDRLKNGALWFFKSVWSEGWSLQMEENIFVSRVGATAKVLRLRVLLEDNWSTDRVMSDLDIEHILPELTFQKGSDLIVEMRDEITKAIKESEK